MPHRNLFAAGVALAAATLLSACQTQTDQFGRARVSPPAFGQMLGSVPSAAGSVQPSASVVLAATDASEDPTSSGGRVVQVLPDGRGGHRILVDGRVVATNTADDRVRVQGVYEGGGRRYAVISEESGGNACPALYRAIDLSNEAAQVSPQFGSCSDLPDIKVVGGALRVSVPRFRAAPAVIVTFKNGRLSR